MSKKFYILKNISQHPFRIRENVKILHDSGPFLTVTNFGNKVTGVVYREELTINRPPKHMKIVVYGSDSQELKEVLSSFGHDVHVEHIIASYSLAEKIAIMNDIAKDATLLIVSYDYTISVEHNHRLFLAAFARKTRRICYISLAQEANKYVRPADQKIPASLLGINSKRTFYLWYKKLTPLEITEDIKNTSDNVTAIPTGLGRLMVEQWTQFSTYDKNKL